MKVEFLALSELEVPTVERYRMGIHTCTKTEKSQRKSTEGNLAVELFGMKTEIRIKRWVWREDFK